MSTLKTLTSAVTAVALVTGIGLAFAQSEDQPAAEPKAALSEQTPADPNAAMTAQPSDTAQQPADQAQQQTTPPADSSQQQPAMPADSYAKPATQDSMPAPAAAPEPKPKADRN